MTWKSLVRPLFFRLPAESAHYSAMDSFARLASVSLVAKRLERNYSFADRRLRVRTLGLNFANPVGLAAGFDKDARWFRPLGLLGFGAVEIGTVTGQAQRGNPKPRLFRLPEDQALINRMGFNGSGCAAVAETLQAEQSRRRADSPVLGVNIGKSKVVPLEGAAAEYQKSFSALFPYADYFTINVSSPNTPGLRELQGRDHLIRIVEAVAKTNAGHAAELKCGEKPVLLKIAPDLTDSQIDEIAGIVREFSIDGVIATNTTVTRDRLKTDLEQLEKIGDGGLSGRPLLRRSTAVVARLYQQLPRTTPIVGVGGIFDGNDAWDMICAGAKLIQAYTGFVYQGPGFARDINRELVARLESHSFTEISEAVGSRSDYFLR